jgi:transposase
MKAEPDRKYTVEFRDAAVRQVLEGGRSVLQVTGDVRQDAGQLGDVISGWPLRAFKRAPAQPVDDLQAELTRLRQENASLKLEKENVKKAP